MRVKCSDHRAYRLVDGPNSCSGHLEALHGGTWGSVCEIDQRATNVLCKELQCGEAEQPIMIYTRGNGTIWTEQIHCNGNESSLYNCKREPGEENCTKPNPPFIQCQVEWRLYHGITKCEGVIQINHEGDWREVFGNNNTAAVVCRELGCVAPSVQYYMNPDDILRLPHFYRELPIVKCTGEESSLSQCNFYSHNDELDSRRLAAVKCSGRREYWLAGGPNSCSGHLEALHGDTWGSVCYLDQDLRAANVLCKDLQCGEAVPSLVTYTRRPEPIWTEQINCVGNESRLQDCIRNPVIEGNCTNPIPLYIQCKVPVRLSGGTTECEGLIEVNYEGEWRGVFDFYNQNFSTVACRQLGCDTTNVQHYVTTGDGFVDRARSIVIVNCTGEESSLSQCNFASANYVLSSRALMGVKCSDHRKYRLVDGPDDCSGHLEALHGNTWGSVCDIDHDLRAANVLCKELQCGAAVPSLVTYTRRLEKIWTEQIYCVGNESRLYDCIRKPGVEEICTKTSPPSIQCKGFFTSYRLVNGSHLYSGRVEVLYEGRWTAICSDHWGLREANVLCRQLKYGVAVSVPDGGHFGKHNDITTYRFHCRGTEDHLGYCNVNVLGNTKCQSWDTAGVVCRGQKELLRLMDGEDHCAGRLEILTNNTWSTASNDGWGNNETQVVCRELRCGHAVGSFIVEPKTIHGHVYLSGKCRGNETQLSDCSFTRSSHVKTSTNQRKDITMTCSESKQLRLVNGPGRCAGRVEIYHDGRWGTICDDSWDKSDADVVCRQLGCGSAVKATTGAHYGRGTGDIWLDEVECVGNETHIWKCPSKQFGDHNCDHKEDSGVICSEFVDLRLVDGPQECEGWLEVYYNGIWGSVCNNVMPDLSVSVICNHLNCGSNGHLNSSIYNIRRRPFWVDHINCTKPSKLLWECPSSPWNATPCRDSEIAYLHCGKTNTRFESCPTSQPCKDNDRIRLTGGDNRCSGRVEVFFRGQWGTVCDDDWDIDDAKVVCRQIGCGSAMVATTKAVFGKGTGPIWLNSVQCTGYEGALQDCWPKHGNKSDCLHRQDAGVICLDPKDNDSPTVLTTTAQRSATQPTSTLPNVFLIISIISLLLLGIAFTIIVYLIKQSKWSKKVLRRVTSVTSRDPVYEEVNLRSIERNKSLSQHSVNKLHDIEEKLEYYTSEERNDEMIDQGFPLEDTSGYGYDDTGLAHENNNGPVPVKNVEEHGYDDVDMDDLPPPMQCDGEVSVHNQMEQDGSSWKGFVDLNDDHIPNTQVLVSGDHDYDDSMSA